MKLYSSTLHLFLLFFTITTTLLAPQVTSIIEEPSDCSGNSLDLKGCTTVFGNLDLSFESSETPFSGFNVVHYITGNLTLNHSTYANALTSLVQVGGNVVFTGHEPINIPTLTQVNGSVILNTGDSLNCAMFSNLAYVGGDFTAYNCYQFFSETHMAVRGNLHVEFTSGTSSLSLPFSSIGKSLTVNEDTSSTLTIILPYLLSVGGDIRTPEGSFLKLAIQATSLVNITGSIVSQNLIGLQLPSLTTLGGFDVRFDENPTLVSFPSLTQIKGDFKIRQSFISSFEAPNLLSVGSLEINCGESNCISNFSTPNLKTIYKHLILIGQSNVTFGKLEKIGVNVTTKDAALAIINVNAEELPVFPSLTKIPFGNAYIELNYDETYCGTAFPPSLFGTGKLIKFGTCGAPIKCSIPPNTVFKQPSELTTYLTCEVLTGDLYFRPTTTFSSFPKLAVSRLEGSLFIINTTIPISNFNLMPNLTHVTGAVVISNNTGLVSLSGMRLYRIDGGFFAVRNPSLVDLAIISTLTAVGDSSESSQVPLTYFSSEELNALYLTEGYSPLFTLRFNPKITNFTLSNIYFRYISSSAVITGNKLLCPSSFPHVFGEGSLFGECGSCDFDSVYAFPDRFLACTALNLYQEYTFNREMIDFFKGNLESATTMTCYYDGPALELYFPEVDAAQLFPNLVSIYGCRLNFKDITRTGSFELGFPKLVNGISSEFNFENITATSGTVTLFSKLATATVIDFQSLTMNVLNAFPSFTGSPPDSFDSQSISFHDCQFNTLRGFNSTNRALVYFESTAVSNTFSAFQNTTILHTLELNGIDVSKFIFPKLKTVTDSVATVNSNGTSFGPNFPQLGSVSYISVSISEIQTISFAKLQTVDRIFFSELPLLTTISGFDSLTTCIDIHLSTLNAISTLPNFTALATAGNIVLDVLPNITTISSFKNLRNLTTEGDAFGTLTISNHLNLITISGFVRLQSVVGLTLSNCPYLNKISGLQSLSTISSTASFKQLNSGSLTSLALRSLASVGVLEISMNAYLKTFFFPALVELTGDEDNLSGCNSGHIVCIYDNPNFLSLAGFPKLASINGSIDISGNPNFCHGFPTPQAFPDPELYESNNKGDCAVLTFNGVLSTWEDFASIVGYSKISGDVAFSPNFDPTGLYTLPNLNEIIGSLNVSNSQAKNLEFMSSITNVKSLVISNNTALKSLAGFAVVSTSYLVIENNPVLESLPNFSGTTLTAEYGVYPSNTILSIQFNPSLKSLSPLSSSSSSIMITGSGYIYLKNNALLCVDSIPPVFVSSFSPYLKTDNCTAATYTSQINNVSPITNDESAKVILTAIYQVGTNFASSSSNQIDTTTATSLLQQWGGISTYVNTTGTIPTGISVTDLIDAFNKMYDTSMISAFIAAGGGDQLPRITEHLLQTAGKDFSSGCGAAAFEVDAENLYAISFQSDSSATSMEFTTNGVSFTLPAQFSTQVGFNTSGAESSCLGELFAHYKNNPFPPSSRFKSNSISPVISFSVREMEVHDLSDPITFTAAISPGADLSKVICAFYNYSISDWDTRGCSMTAKSSSSVSCSCNHATNFGVLLDLSDNLSEESKQALNYLSAIGCGLSLTGSLLTLIAFALLPKLRTGPVNLVLGLCVAIFFVNLLFLIGMSESSNLSADGCEAVAILLHMFLLISFMIMFCQALHMYLLVVRLSREKDHLIKYYLIVSFVLPIVFVICLVIANAAMKPYRVVDYGGLDSSVGHSCWIGNTNGLLGAFAIPVAVVLVFNLIIFILVLRTFRQIRNDKALVDAKEKKTDTKLYLTVMTLFGLTWIFGYIGYIRGAEFAWYLFVIFNSFQGFFIFIFYCLNPRVIDGIRERVFNLPPKYSLIGSARTSNATSAGTLSRSSKTTPMHSVTDEEKGASSAYSSTFDSQDMEMKETKK